MQAGSDPLLVKALQCLLSEQKAYYGKINGRFRRRDPRRREHLAEGTRAARPLLLEPPLLDDAVHGGSAAGAEVRLDGPAVRRLQRTLNAATHGTDLPVTGVFAQLTDSALRGWQISTQRKALGVVNPSTWKALAAGTR